MRIFIYIVLILILSSCGSHNIKPKESYFPETQIEAGQVYVSMQPPMLWYDIVDDLKPNFAVTSANEFLNAVLQVTSSNQQIDQSRNSFGVGIGLPTSSTTGTDTTNTNTSIADDGTTTTTGTNIVESTTTQADGNVPSTNSNSATSSFLTGQPPVSENEFGVDPFLQYRAATALYQEVQLLNRYLDAEVAANGTIPYLFRAQISVQPNARNASLDIYTELFVEIFNQEETINNSEAPINELNLTTDINQEKIRPEIIPLVVIDNLERSASRRIESAVNQLNFALSGLIGGVGLGTNSDSIKEQLNDIKALDFNSITTVAKSDHDQLTVRIGAVNSSSGLSTIARSYDVTFLVLWPREYNKMKGTLRQFSHMRRTDTGERLPLLNSRYQKQFAKKLVGIAKTRGIDKKLSEQLANCIVFNISETDEVCNLENRKNLYTFKLLTPFKLQYDAEIFELVRDYLNAIFIKNDEFILPAQSFAAPLPQLAIMNDSGAGTANVILGDAKNFGNAENIVAAMMFVTEEDVNNVLEDQSKSSMPEKILKELNSKFDAFYRPVKTKYTSRKNSLYGNSVLAASSISINSEGLLTATFPSPTSIGRRKDILNSKSYLFLDRRLLPHERDPVVVEENKNPIDDINSTRGIYSIVLNKSIGKVPVPVLHKAKILPTKPKVLANGKSEFQLTILANSCPANAICPTNIDKYQVVINDYFIDTVTSDVNPTIDNTKNSFDATLNKAYKVTLNSLAASAEFTISINAIDNNGKVVTGQTLIPIKITTN